MFYVRIIDENGYFLNDAFVDELTEYTIETPCPAGFYHPMWDGEKWVEGGTKPELTQRQKEELYSAKVVELIRYCYSENDELAIIRKMLAGINTEEFNEYNTYVEKCKLQAKEMI